MQIKIEKLVYGGSGMGFLDRLPVFVPMTVPGDEIECKITHKFKGYATADLLKILKPSPNRTTAKCEYFGRCGGCQWQHIDYATQILWKQLILEEQLKRIGKFKEPNVLPTIPSPKAWNYRDRIKLHKDKKGIVGFYAANSHEIVEIEDCLIAEPTAKTVDTNTGFVQINPSQNVNLQVVVAEHVKTVGPKSILELYCGNGNLTMPIVNLAEEITASDADKRSVAHAFHEAESLGLTHVHFVCQSAKKTLEYALKHGKTADCLVVDPPRSGCKEILKEIIKLKPSSIIYVSCDPATLARDLCELANGGYKLLSSQPIDMFPQTYHIESISVLARSLT